MRTGYKQDDSVYHFTSTEILQKFVIPQHSLRLARFGSTFDPDEHAGVSISIGNDTNADPTDETVENTLAYINSEVLKARNQDVRLLCLANSYSPISEKYHDDLNSRKAWAQHSLWAHFADRHRGVAIELDLKKLSTTAYSTLSRHGIVATGDVAYIGENHSRHSFPAASLTRLAPCAKDLTLEEIFSQTFFGPLFQKAGSWAYEQEYRVVCISNCKREVYLPVDDLIKSITIGSDTDRSEIDSIRWAMKVSGWGAIPLYQMDWNFGVTREEVVLDDPSIGDFAGGLTVRPLDCPDISSKCPDWIPGPQNKVDLWQNIVPTRNSLIYDLLRSIAEDTTKVGQSVPDALAGASNMTGSNSVATQRFVNECQEPFATQVITTFNYRTRQKIDYNLSNGILLDGSANVVEIRIVTSAPNINKNESVHRITVARSADDHALIEMRSKVISLINDSLII